jgi:hypothetical protein
MVRSVIIESVSARLVVEPASAKEAPRSILSSLDVLEPMPKSDSRRPTPPQHSNSRLQIHPTKLVLSISLDVATS